MRLLEYNNADQLSLTKDLVGNDIPKYAILSHTWGADTEEVTFKDIIDGAGEDKPGYKKVRFCAQQAADDGLQYFWVDTCCIDKSSSAELQEAITSMFTWYRNADKCYVYLTDVPSPTDNQNNSETLKAAFLASRWFTRGWTLQELIAPRSVEFFCWNGKRLGDKHLLEGQLHKITGIPVSALRGTSLSEFSVDKRMSWVANRETKRGEDKAYSLLGIFDISMPLLYGEGRVKALYRLQEAIDKSFNAQGSNPLDRLPYATGAPFNSYQRQEEPTCLKNTRVDILREIDTWANGQDERCIFWLNGLAGTGKSTIARTIACRYSEKKQLGASFFFTKGGGDVSHAGKFVTSIAVQLASSVPPLRWHICAAVTEHSDIANQSLRDQWDQLVLRPLSKLDSNDCRSSYVLVIDALDECDDNNNIRIILQLLAEARSLQRVRLRILLTSRPEIPIRYGFNQIPDAERQDFVLHSISPSIIDHDISIFLEYNLRLIGQEEKQEPGWPGSETVQCLVETAHGLFIWAAIACRFIREGLSVEERLHILLEGSKVPTTPEGHLNEIYITVLRNSIRPGYIEQEIQLLYSMLREVLGSLVVLFSPLAVESLSRLLHTTKQKVDLAVKNLHAILDITEDQNRPLRLHHPSFRDFLLDKHRCIDTNFQVDEKQAHQTLVDSCIRLMSTSLKQDICGLNTPGILVTDVKSSQVERSLPPELQYACLYWTRHLQKSGSQLHDNSEVYEFLQKHLLHWLEALGWIGKMPEGIYGITSLESIAVTETSTQLSSFLHDAKRFILSCSIAGSSPLQLYSSALIFAPKESIIQNTFKNYIPGWISQQPEVELGWHAILQTLEAHSDIVNSVAFSHDSKLLASASYDKTVKIWDASTGTCQQTLEGHSSIVSSVAFSHDSKLLASASEDKTVKIWDASTSTCQQTLKGHSDWVSSVAFSHDSKLLASASYDKTVKIWDASTGTCQQTLEGHSYKVSSVAFSHDSKLLASASVPSASAVDGTVKIWDASTGTCQQTLKGHSGKVCSVAFSHNSKLLASASVDGTAKIWDASTGTCQQTLKSHWYIVFSIAFSHDSKLLASASYDKTVKIWDVSTGTCQQTLEGHSSTVSSVTFSHNSKLLASASYDKTVKIWDTSTGTYQQMLKGHSSGVSSITFSHDSKLLASASYDCTVKIWDASTGTYQQTLKGHNDTVSSVAFSHDSKLLASASDDCKVMIWDASTGTCQQTLEGYSSYIVSSTAFSHDSKLLASASYDNTVKIWDTSTGTCQQTLKGHSDKVSSVAFSHNSKLLASVSYDKTVKIWDASTGTCQQTLEGHGDSVSSVAFSHDSKLLASASYDCKVMIWDISTGTCQQTVAVNTYATSLSFDSIDLNLLTNISSIKVDRTRLPTMSEYPQEGRDKCGCQGLGMSEPWITWNTQNLLWLPPDYRSIKPDVSLSGSRVAGGCWSGKVFIIGFSLADLIQCQGSVCYCHIPKIPLTNQPEKHKRHFGQI